MILSNSGLWVHSCLYLFIFEVGFIMIYRLIKMILILCTFVYVQAHSWEELVKPELSQERIEQLLTIAEIQQSEVVDNSLPQDELSVVYAKDWLEHFSNLIGLDTYQGQADFRNVISALYQEEDVFLAWQHEMQHLVHIYDSSMLAVDETIVMRELDSLNLDEETADLVSYRRAEELSYLLSFIEISDTERAAIAPFMLRIAQLIESVNEGQ